MRLTHIDSRIALCFSFLARQFRPASLGEKEMTENEKLAHELFLIAATALTNKEEALAQLAGLLSDDDE